MATSVARPPAGRQPRRGYRRAVAYSTPPAASATAAPAATGSAPVPVDARAPPVEPAVVEPPVAAPEVVEPLDVAPEPPVEPPAVAGPADPEPEAPPDGGGSGAAVAVVAVQDQQRGVVARLRVEGKLRGLGEARGAYCDRAGGSRHHLVDLQLEAQGEVGVVPYGHGCVADIAGRSAPALAVPAVGRHAPAGGGTAGDRGALGDGEVDRGDGFAGSRVADPGRALVAEADGGRDGFAGSAPRPGAVGHEVGGVRGDEVRFLLVVAGIEVHASDGGGLLQGERGAPARGDAGRRTLRAPPRYVLVDAVHECVVEGVLGGLDGERHAEPVGRPRFVRAGDGAAGGGSGGKAPACFALAVLAVRVALDEVQAARVHQGEQDAVGRPRAVVGEGDGNRLGLAGLQILLQREPLHHQVGATDDHLGGEVGERRPVRLAGGPDGARVADAAALGGEEVEFGERAPAGPEAVTATDGRGAGELAVRAAGLAEGRIDDARDPGQIEGHGEVPLEGAGPLVR
ncbi:hypothetical protein [Streptomyces sp. Ncost-T10-10d]|uniref:hypothetical protein n=1 Tax=Streptomyces sp. Ncost-T10-10d TaxID=1839774 RepID=UPI003522AB0A